jgi:hypothetical protein
MFILSLAALLFPSFGCGGKKEATMPKSVSRAPNEQPLEVPVTPGRNMKIDPKEFAKKKG